MKQIKTDLGTDLIKVYFDNGKYVVKAGNRGTVYQTAYVTGDKKDALSMAQRMRNNISTVKSC